MTSFLAQMKLLALIQFTSAMENNIACEYHLTKFLKISPGLPIVKILALCILVEQKNRFNDFLKPSDYDMP